MPHPQNTQSVEEIVKEFKKRFTYGVILSASSDLSAGTDIAYRHPDLDGHHPKHLISFLRKALTTAIESERNRMAQIIKHRLPNPMTDEEKPKYHCEASILHWGEQLLQALNPKE